MKRSNTGFTIVELLIVIVVIGILAAITIVAYNGIQERARVSSVSSALSQAAKKLAVYQIDNPDVYPADKTALDAIGISDTTSVTYQYTRTSSTPNTYCLTATTGTTSYKFSNTSTSPSAGACPGHGVGGVAAITNMIPNPSAESNVASWNSIGSAVLVQSPDVAFSGTKSVKVTPSTTTYTGVGFTIPGVIGTQYTYSAYVYSPTPQSINFAADGLAVNTSATVGPSWQRFTLTGTKVSGSALFVRAIAASAPIFYVDAVMYTEGATTYTYADGNSPNWVWNTTTNNSTSTGPPL
jgi:prepilin-type N-terminal cleavage/methylation domain-containing protein